MNKQLKFDGTDVITLADMLDDYSAYGYMRKKGVLVDTLLAEMPERAEEIHAMESTFKMGQAMAADDARRAAHRHGRTKYIYHGD